jgi:hypothetical protein
MTVSFSWAERAAESFASAKDAGLHGPDGHIEQARHLAVLESFDIPQEHGLAQLGWQRDERARHFVSGDNCSFQPLASGSRFERGLVNCSFHAAGSPDAMGPSRVHHNLKQPGPEAATGAEATQSFVGSEKRFLRHILRVAPVGQQSMCQPDDAVLVFADETYKRVIVTAANGVDQSLVFVDSPGLSHQ